MSELNRNDQSSDKHILLGCDYGEDAPAPKERTLARRRARAKRRANRRAARAFAPARPKPIVLPATDRVAVEVVERLAEVADIKGGRITVEDVADRVRFTFHHSLVPQSVYQKLLTIQRWSRRVIVRMRIRVAGGSVVAAELV